MKTLFPLIISNTDLQTWSMCEYRWFRERCQWLRKPEKSVNLDLAAGVAFHAGIEKARRLYFEEGMPSFEAVSEGKEYCKELLYAEEEQDELKSPERMGLAIELAFRKFPLESDELKPIKLADGKYAFEHKLAIELPIKHPELDTNLMLKAKLDSLGLYNGRPYIEDWKTCKAIYRDEVDRARVQGQFIEYPFIAKSLGIDVKGVLLRKACIQKTQVKVEEFEVPITDYLVDTWEKSLLAKVNRMVERYEEYKEHKHVNLDPRELFVPDYGLGCTAFNKPCPFVEGCASEYGERFIEMEYKQIHWDYEERKEVPLEEYMKMVGVVD